MTVKKLRKSLVVFSLVLSVFAILSITPMQAAETPEKEVENVIHNYFKAVKQGNAKEMARLSDDKRFPNEEIQVKNYKEILNDDELHHAKIVSLKEISANEFVANIETTTKNAGKVVANYKIINREGQWVLLVGNDIDFNSSNFEYE
ncbi:hypothetical protein [Paenibacillus aquistagni]|uniref:hypothetical protein n=1 Tax=Paenibacillus aquistagni TaxID=1852522 RepID=UPI000B4FD60B|nr:hypothetical protein [Paenibacillus aquistagni]NMM51807.1 hypothetical protein [Paenibacillus aquistagni]